MGLARRGREGRRRRCQEHRRRRETKRSPATPISPKGGGGTGPSLCCSSSPMSQHRLVVAPRLGLRRAPNKRYRIYESEYLDIENDPGHPTLIGLLQAELVQCDGFHIHPLLMAVWVERLTLGQG